MTSSIPSPPWGEGAVRRRAETEVTFGAWHRMRATVMENPYQPPAYQSSFETQEGIAQVEKLRKVAFCQKGVLICLLVYLLLVLASYLLSEWVVEYPNSYPPQWPTWLALIDALAGAVLAFRLSLLVYGRITGIVMGLLTLIPCLGLFVLLYTNGVATVLLRRHGIRVGLLGANLSKITNASRDKPI